MKKQIFYMLGAFSLCCLMSTQMVTAQEVTTSTTCATRAASSFVPVYATFVTPGPSAWINTEEITVPLTNVQTARGVIFDEETSSFILPKGVYSLQFQFIIEAEFSTGLAFDEMYLDINNNAARASLVWFEKTHSPSSSFIDSAWKSFSGSKIFSVGSDNTYVKCILVRPSTANIRFAFSQVGTETPENNAALICLHKIDSCD